jgi:hypothetical protein
MRDSAGNIHELTSDLVRLAVGVNDVRVSPADTVVSMGSIVKFTAMGLDSTGEEVSEVELDTVAWSLAGSGFISREGYLQVLRVGEVYVIGEYGGLRDTALVVVDSGSVSFPSAGDSTFILKIGRDLELHVPLLPLPGRTDTVMELYFLREEQRPPGFRLTGPAVVFQEKEGQEKWSFGDSTLLRFQIDSLMADPGEMVRIYVYEKTDDQGGSWIQLSGVREIDNWISIKTDSLGTYLVGLDTSAPTLEWIERRAAANAYRTIGFAFRTNDNIANPEVRLRVRRGGAGIDNVYPLVYQAGVRAFDTVPGSLVTERGLWYSIEVSDGANLTSLDSVDVTVNIDSGTALPAHIVYPEDRYNMISVPLNPLERLVRDLFFDDWGPYDPERWRLFDYVSGFTELRGEDEIASGRGYWLRTRGFSPRITLSASQTHPVLRSFAVPVVPGWNAISNPFMFNVDVAGVTLQNGVPVQYLYAYENDLWLTRPEILLRGLEPWKGYVIWIDSAGGIQSTDSVRIAPVEYIAPVGKRGAGKRGKYVVLSAESGLYRDGLAIFGYNYPGSRNGKDARDHFKPRFFRKPLELEVSVPWDRNTPYLTDYRGAIGEGQSWSFRIMNATGEDAALTFKGLRDIPEGMRAVLLDETRAAVRELETSSVKYRSQSPEPEEFEILIGTPEFLEKRIQDFISRHRVFALKQNYPNPFATWTSIRYSLPSSKEDFFRVRLEVFDIKGRLAVELVNKRQASDLYTVRWNGVDAEGTALPSGTYICRLRAGTRWEAKKKMVLLR